MRIIREGKMIQGEKIIRRFDCPICGCIFDADWNEYEREDAEYFYTENGVMKKMTLSKASSICPNCNHICVRIFLSEGCQSSKNPI